MTPATDGNDSIEGMAEGEHEWINTCAIHRYIATALEWPMALDETRALAMRPASVR